MANAIPKRKMASDVLDYLNEDQKEKDKVKKVPVEKLKPFHDHPFRLYEGQKLQDMVESIKEYGVLTPIICRECKEGLEILSGHNRLQAAVLAGLAEVPVLVKYGLNEQEAYTYVIETNLIQRGFAELRQSEQAAALEMEYSKVISQGKRDAIREEIERLSGITSGQSDQKCTKRDAISKGYGLSGSSMARLLRINYLIKPLKEWVDEGKLKKGVYFHLSFLPEKQQEMVYQFLESKTGTLSEEMAKKMREKADKLTKEDISLMQKTQQKPYETIKVSAPVYQKYLKDMDKMQANDVIEKALAMYFASGSEKRGYQNPA